jgi:putative FmdB family regulatory protein
MPIYDFVCKKCGAQREVVAQMGDEGPRCCGTVMRRAYGPVVIRDSRSLTGKRNELFINRIDEINKRQADRGERLTLPHPSEVL